MKKFILFFTLILILSACGNYEDDTLALSGYEELSDSEESAENDELVNKEEEEVIEENVTEVAEEKLVEETLIENEIKEDKLEESTKSEEPANPKDNEIVRGNVSSNYAEYPNKSLSWWYKVPKPTHQEVPADIDNGVKAILEKYDGIWQYPKDEKVVYITMDEGYEFEENSNKILDIARDKNFKITFFITGDFIRQRPDLVKRMYNEGHLVGNHTNKHLNGPRALEESDERLINDITSIESMYRDLTGTDLQPFFRPPEGVYSERSLKIVNDLGYRPVFWSFAYKDWETNNQPSREFALDKITGQLHNGSVLLIHAVSKTNVEILPELVDTIRAKGFRIDTIDNIPSNQAGY